MTALPTIVGELGGLAHLSWIVTSYLLATTVVTPLYGKLGDLFGRKVVLQAAIVIFLIGSVLCGASQNLIQLIVFRFIQGLGGGGLLVVSMAVVADVIPPAERGRYQGFFGAVFGASTVLGPLIGGFFVVHLRIEIAGSRSILRMGCPGDHAAAKDRCGNRRHQEHWASAHPLAPGFRLQPLATRAASALANRSPKI